MATFSKKLLVVATLGYIVKVHISVYVERTVLLYRTMSTPHNLVWSVELMNHSREREN